MPTDGPDPFMERDVVVVGAGLAGLTAVRRLTQAAQHGGQVYFQRAIRQGRSGGSLVT
jgi:cation diffusion facilitator CzcD-associated flavoprotein CzcO